MAERSNRTMSYSIRPVKLKSLRGPPREPSSPSPLLPRIQRWWVSRVAFDSYVSLLCLCVPCGLSTPSVYLSVRLVVCLSICLFTHRSLCPPINPILSRLFPCRLYTLSTPREPRAPPRSCLICFTLARFCTRRSYRSWWCSTRRMWWTVVSPGNG